jgi:hypothetical protein
MPPKTIKILIVICLFFCATFALQAQKNYYVSPSGNDSNAGTINTPFKTIQKACNSITSGDTINIMKGTYNEMVAIYKGGDSLKGFITIRNFQSDTVIVDGTGLTKRGLITIYYQNYIRITGLILQNAIKNDAIGFLVEGTCSNITFENNIVRQIYFSANASDAVTSSKNSHPILCNGIDTTNAITKLKILNNQIYNCRTGYSEALTLNGNVDGFLVQGNVVRDISNIGIDIAGNYGICSNTSKDHARNGSVIGNNVYNCKSGVAAADGIYVDGGAAVIVERNEVHNCQWGIEVGCENAGKTTSEIIVRDNTIYNNALSGLVLGGYNYPSTGKVVNSKFLNNTTYNNDSTGNGGGELHLSYSENCNIENNIFYSDRKSLLATMEYQSTYAPSGLALNYNLWFTGYAANAQFNWGKDSYSTFTSYSNTTGQDIKSLYRDPLFDNKIVTPPDFSLSKNSPAIDSGNPLFIVGASELDKAGNARVANTRVDIGAFEYSGTTDIEKNANQANHQCFLLYNNYPNPFNPSTVIAFEIPYACHVSLKIWDVMGKEIFTLIDEFRAAGRYNVHFDASNLSSGIYFYSLISGEHSVTKRMLLLK